MGQDLKIELSKVLALHEASLRLEHAIRESASPDSRWTDFAPSRFVYAFFTFNTIYSWDWKRSFEVGAPTRWQKKENDSYPREDEQFKAYIRFCDEVLTPDTVAVFSKRFSDACEIMGVQQPATSVRNIQITNADKRLKKLKAQVPPLVEQLHKGTVKPRAFHSSACHVLNFIYGVRCNLFHGRKSHVRLLDQEQQSRLLVYAAILAATNGLLFDVTAKKNLGFMPVRFDFRTQQGSTNESLRHDESRGSDPLFP